MHTDQQQLHRNAGFSLSELMIVITIMILLLAVAIPATNTLFSGGQSEIAINAVSSASSAVNSYSALKPAFDVGSYSGAALVFDTANQIRLTQNYALARSSGTGANSLLERPNVSPYRPALNGYRDIELDGAKQYVALPEGAGVMGIIRTEGSGGAGELKFIAPPFAVRFNEFGTLIPASYTKDTKRPLAENVVIYDGNYDGQYNIGTEQGSSREKSSSGDYDPTQWDPTHDNYSPSFVIDNRTQQFRLPFERLECVVGVLIYNKRDVPQDIESEITKSSELYDWFVENGTPLFFNRFTGAILKN